MTAQKYSVHNLWDILCKAARIDGLEYKFPVTLARLINGSSTLMAKASVEYFVSENYLNLLFLSPFRIHGWEKSLTMRYKQRVLMHGHQGWNVRHGLCHIYTIFVYIWVVFCFCLFCCLFIIVTTQFVALYKPCKPKPKPSTYDPPDNHPLAEIQRPILRPEPKQQICHQHANTDHFGK